MEPTLKQRKTYRKFLDWTGLFTCPKCKENYEGPRIENPGEYTTQIHCPYGCNFITLDEHE